MYQRQKINLASLILSQGLHLLHKYIPNQEEWLKFQQAEANNLVQAFFQQASYLSSQEAKALYQYYTTNSQLGKLMVNRHYELALYPIDREAKAFHQNQGIIEERNFYERVMESHPNKSKVISAIEEEIRVITEAAEVIVKLWDFDERFEFDTTEKMPSYEQLIADKDTHKLALKVLRNIAPEEGQNIIPLDEELCLEIWQVLLKEFGYTLLDEEVPRPQIEQILSNQELFIQYVSEELNTIEGVAMMCFLLDFLPQEHRHSPEYVGLLWKTSHKYTKYDYLQLKDWASINRLARYTASVATKVKQPLSHWSKLVYSNDRLLAESYVKLWEYDQAIHIYQRLLAEVTQHEQVNYDTESLIFALLECYETAGQKEVMVACVITFLQDKRYVISQEIRETLEVMLLDWLQDLDHTYQFTTETGRLLQKLNQDFAENDNFSQNIVELLIQKGQQIEALMAKRLGGKVQDKEQLLSNLHTYLMLDDLEGIKHTLQQFTKVDKFALGVSHKILLELCHLKVQSVDGNPQAVDEFKKRLPDLQDYFENDQVRHWYIEYLRATPLVIVTQPEFAQEVIKYAERFLIMTLRDFANEQDLGDLNIVRVQSEIERAYKAIIVNIDEADWPQKDMLLAALWKIIAYKNRFFNRVFAKQQILRTSMQVYYPKVEKLKALTYEWYIKGNEWIDLELKTLVNQIQQLEKPYLDVENNLNEYDYLMPQQKSVLFTLFTKFEGERDMLVISYDPFGHQLQANNKFAFGIEQNFQDIEARFNNTKSGSKWGFEGVLSILKEQELLESFHHSLLYYFRQEHDLSNKVFWQLEKLRSEDATEDAGRPEKTNFYCDNFLHYLPIDAIELEYQTLKPVYTRYNTVFVLNKEQPNVQAHYNKMCIFSEIPKLGNEPFLTFSEQERLAVVQHCQQNYMSFQAYTYQEANVANLKKSLKDDIPPHILHFACHGLASEELPAYTNALLLAPTQPNEPNSALLTFLDILELDLRDVRLVVLSACNSALGSVLKGAPMQGLAYAFLSAGADYVLASRNKVNDQSTAIFIDKFYETLLAQHTVPNALRITKSFFYNHPEAGVATSDIASWGIWT